LGFFAALGRFLWVSAVVFVSVVVSSALEDAFEFEAFSSEYLAACVPTSSNSGNSSRACPAPKSTAWPICPATLLGIEGTQLEARRGGAGDYGEKAEFKGIVTWMRQIRAKLVDLIEFFPGSMDAAATCNIRAINAMGLWI
jgi:hypothetical protein